MRFPLRPEALKQRTIQFMQSASILFHRDALAPGTGPAPLSSFTRRKALAKHLNGPPLHRIGCGKSYQSEKKSFSDHAGTVAVVAVAFLRWLLMHKLLARFVYAVIVGSPARGPCYTVDRTCMALRGTERNGRDGGKQMGNKLRTLASEWCCVNLSTIVA